MIELATAIRARELSPPVVADHYLRRMQELNDQVGAFYTVTAELASEQALTAEKALAGAAGPAELPPLTGVPIPIKDLNGVAGVRLTFGSLSVTSHVWADVQTAFLSSISHVDRVAHINLRRRLLMRLARRNHVWMIEEEYHE